MGEDTVVLSADNCSFVVPRSVLAKHSVYFSAALESGMSECVTGRFVFSEITASQLTLFVQCAKSDFTYWPENLSCEQSVLPDGIHCEVFVSNLHEVFGLAILADYLQIPVLTDMCVTRLSRLLACALDSYGACEHKDDRCHLFERFITLWATFGTLLTCTFNDILFRFTTRNPVDILTTPTSLPGGPIRATVLELVVSVLASDMLCVSDEDQVLDIAVKWIRLLTPSGDQSSDLAVAQSFFNCIRLGLLSPQGRSNLSNFWLNSFPDIRWQNRLTYDGFLSTLLFDTDRSTTPSILSLCCCSRASTPCLLSLIPNFKDTGYDLCVFNLLTGEHRTFDFAEHLLNHSSLGTYDVDIHVYLCHSSVTLSDSSVVLLIHDSSQDGSLSGFVWCLATGKAKWIPDLPIHSGELIGFSAFNNLCGPSRRFGLVTLNTGLFVYFLAPVHSEVCIFAFLFDFTLWTWHTIPPTSLTSCPIGASVRFTPVEQLSSITLDGWIYAYAEIDVRSNSLSLPISRHNLHRLSLLRSVFCRFRPLECTDWKSCQLQVEILPPAPFLVRIYRLLVLSAEGRNYLFAFGTCCRDQHATRFCLDVEGRQWIRWSTWKRSTDEDTMCASSTDSRDIGLLTNLSPELLGFRGLMYCSQIPAGWLDAPILPPDGHVCPSVAPKTISGNDGKYPDAITPTLVMVGRPDYLFEWNGHAAFGIWFYQPMIITNPDCSIPNFEPHKPTLPLPSYVTQRFCDSSSSSSTVIKINWDNVIQSSKLFRFTTVPPEDRVTGERNDLSSCVSSSSNFTCLRYAWNWASTDSD